MRILSRGVMFLACVMLLIGCGEEKKRPPVQDDGPPAGSPAAKTNAAKKKINEVLDKRDVIREEWEKALLSADNKADALDKGAKFIADHTEELVKLGKELEPYSKTDPEKGTLKVTLMKRGRDEKWNGKLNALREKYGSAPGQQDLQIRSTLKKAAGM